MTAIGYQPVDVHGALSTGPIPVEVTGRAAQVLSTADPQAWLFVQRARYLDEGHCDPYAEQMLRRMGLLPSR